MWAAIVQRIRLRQPSFHPAVLGSNPRHLFRFIVKLETINVFASYIVLKGASSVSFTFIFGLFKQTIIFFTINWCEKYPSSIRCWDSNSWPSHYESSPLTTRPGSRPIVHYSWYCRKDENKQKEAGFGRFLKNTVSRKFWRNRLQLNFNLSWPNRKRPTPSLSTLTSISR